MAKVTGVVTKHDKNKFGGWSIVVDGNYYNSKFEIKCGVGDNVEFDDGGKNYCSKLRVLSKGAPVATPKPAGGSSNRDTSIVRQNALRHATAAVTAHGGTVDQPDELIAARIIAMAKVFEAYVNEETTVHGPTVSGDFIESAA
jgi:hypothetical protein